MYTTSTNRSKHVRADALTHTQHICHIHAGRRNQDIGSCVLFSLVGSRHGWRPFPPSNFVAAMLRTILNDSSGGVDAKIASWPAVRISLATSRLRMLEAWSSPLLTSTQRTDMGARPFLVLASLTVLNSHTPLLMK